MGIFGKKKKDMEKEPDDEIPCPNCGTMLSKDATICYSCGLDLQKWREKEEKEKIRPYRET